MMRFRSFLLASHGNSTKSISRNSLGVYRRQLCEAATASKTDSGKIDKVENKLGALYQEMLHRGRGENRLALGDLRKLLEQCITPDEIKYGKLLLFAYSEV